MSLLVDQEVRCRLTRHTFRFPLLRNPTEDTIETLVRIFCAVAPPTFRKVVAEAPCGRGHPLGQVMHPGA